MLERLLADQAEMKAKIDAEHEMMDKMMASQERMMAKWDSHLGNVEACEEKTEACLEKKEPTPEETIGAAKDRSRDLRLDVGCRGQLKTRTKHDGGCRQECAAAV
jgi:hypothetical protein